VSGHEALSHTRDPVSEKVTETGFLSDGSEHALQITFWCDHAAAGDIPCPPLHTRQAMYGDLLVCQTPRCGIT
jgi:hypothetical protein